MRKTMTNFVHAVLLAAIFFSMTMFCTSVYANAKSYTVDVPSGYLALRNAKASDDSNIIGKLYSGDEVELKDDSDAVFWYVYSSKLNSSGYVNKNFLLDEDGDSVTDGDEYSVRVESGYLALRSKKEDKDDNIIGELYTGDIVEVKDKQDSTYWYVYSARYDNSGYVNKNYLIASSGGSGSEGGRSNKTYIESSGSSGTSHSSGGYFSFADEPEKREKRSSSETERKMRECGSCGGSGKCSICNGRGGEYRNKSLSDSTQVWDKCDFCTNGDCRNCKGSGKLPV